MFTVEEAVTLLIGTDFVEQRFDPEYGLKARTSSKKIESILPEPVRADASRVRKTMRLSPGNRVSLEEEKDYVEIVRRAILQERKVEFKYVKKCPILTATGRVFARRSLWSSVSPRRMDTNRMV